MWTLVRYHQFVCDSCLKPAQIDGYTVINSVRFGPDGDLSQEQQTALESKGWKFLIPPGKQTLCNKCAPHHYEGCTEIH